MDNTKHLPANAEAERATLGALLLDRDGILVVAAWLSPDHFTLEKHRWVYEAVLACYQQRVPPDIQTVADELRRRDRLAPIGDIPFLMDLSSDVPTAYHVEYYARIVERTAFLRTVIQVGGRIAALGFDEAGDVAAVASAAQALLTTALVRKEAGGPVEMSALLTEMEEAMSSETAPGTPTGFVDYDRLTGGLHPGDLLILAARPGVGKSAWALNLCHRMLKASAGRIIFVSLEMPRLQLMQRLMALQTGIPAKAIRENRLTQSQIQSVADAMGQMYHWQLSMDDAGALSFAELRLRVLRDVAVNGSPALIVVDYLQLVTNPQGREFEPRAGGRRGVARSQGAGEGGPLPDPGAVAAVTGRRDPHQPCPSAVRSARLGRAGAGRRHRDVYLSRGAVRQGHRQERRRRAAHREAAQRPGGRGAAAV